MPRASSNRHRFRVDSSAFTHVAVCDLDGCPWRGQANTRPWAWRMLARHITRAHPERKREAHLARKNAGALTQ